MDVSLTTIAKGIGRNESSNEKPQVKKSTTRVSGTHRHFDIRGITIQIKKIEVGGCLKKSKELL